MSAGPRSSPGSGDGADSAPAPVVFADVEVEPGGERRFELPVSRLPSGGTVSLPLRVLNGARAGPSVWLTAAIHGDELNGVEIIRQVLDALDPAQLAGCVVAVPIVNVFGFVQESRYLPDRRDLNRSFPGSPKGSLAAQLAHLLMSEVVSKCQYGVDLHTGARSRTNLPQVRADLSDPGTLACARAFAAPVMIDARLRDGSLRAAAQGRGARVLLYEGGEASRFDRRAIRVGTAGVLRLLKFLGMVAQDVAPPAPDESPLEAQESRWIRAGRGGILHLDVELGRRVVRGEVLGRITDVFGEHALRVRAPADGVIIGQTTDPLVYRGDAMLNLAICQVR